MLLGHSAAFNPVDHSILLEGYKVGFGFPAQSWFMSYIQERNYFVSIGNYVSDLTTVMGGVPKG